MGNSIEFCNQMLAMVSPHIHEFYEKDRVVC